ncbi:MAG TPA: AraC family transcriptional regulator [Opitutaceae bacterium]
MHDYFTYLPLVTQTLAWGAAVTSAGYVHTPPGSDYPAPNAGHPPDHLFTWGKGRALDVWQILLIQEGAGWFESRPTGRCRVRSGTVFILFPGVWHCYAPDRDTGWTESWIELSGPVPERLRELKTLDPKRAVYHLGPQPELTEAMDRCHRLAQGLPSTYAGQLSATALQVLALVLTLRDATSGPPRHVETIVQRARNLLVERCDQPLQIKQLARELGVGETHFRRAFKAHTGLSPKEYVMDLRLRRVRTLLQGTSLTITEIAERMGYNSPYHLSAAFKKQTGHSPSAWRYRRG